VTDKVRIDKARTDKVRIDKVRTDKQRGQTNSEDRQRANKLETNNLREQTALRTNRHNT